MIHAWCSADGVIGFGKHIPPDAIDFASTTGSLPRLRRVVEGCAQRACDGKTLFVPDYSSSGSEKMAVLIRFASAVERGMNDGR